MTGAKTCICWILYMINSGPYFWTLLLIGNPIKDLRRSDNNEMKDLFEFSSVTEMRWIRFRKYFDKVIQMDDGVFQDSPRSQVILEEFEKQQAGLGIGSNKEPKSGALVLYWKGSEFVQTIEMFEEAYDSTLPISHLEFTIEVCEIDEIYTMEVLTLLESMSRGRAGFTYVYKNSKIVLKYKISVTNSDEYETYSMIMCLFYRQHSYATLIITILRNANLVADSNENYDFDQFVAVINSQEYRDSLQLQGFDDNTSPEGVPEAYMFKGEKPDIGIKKLAKSLKGENIKYYFENSIHSSTFKLRIFLDNSKIDFSCRLEYSNVKSPIFLTGENEFKNLTTKDQTLSFYLIQTDRDEELSNCNIEINLGANLITENNLNSLFLDAPSFAFMGQTRSVKYLEKDRLLFELPISLGQILYLYTNSTSIDTYYAQLTNFIYKYISEVTFKINTIKNASTANLDN
jgi:hypothetical protein